MTRLEASLVEIVTFLDRSGFPYMLIGGLAVAAWGEPRATLDVDLLVWVDPEGFDEAVRSVAGQFHAAPDALVFARRSRVLPVTTADGVRADIVFAALPEEREFISRAQTRRIAGADIRVACVEDLIFMKLISERLKDMEDARLLIRRFRASLDRSSLEPRLQEIAAALARQDIIEIFRREME
jgi:hypothetical protein